MNSGAILFVWQNRQVVILYLKHTSLDINFLFIKIFKNQCHVIVLYVWMSTQRHICLWYWLNLELFNDVLRFLMNELLALLNALNLFTHYALNEKVYFTWILFTVAAIKIEIECCICICSHAYVTPVNLEKKSGLPQKHFSFILFNNKVTAALLAPPLCLCAHYSGICSEWPNPSSLTCGPLIIYCRYRPSDLLFFK